MSGQPRAPERPARGVRGGGGAGRGSGGAVSLLRGRHELRVRGHVALVQEPAGLLLLTVAQTVLENTSYFNYYFL